MAIPLPASASEAYELLRQRVVEPDSGIEYAADRGVVIRCGLASWAQQQSSATTVAPTATQRPLPNYQAERLPAPAELVKLVAGLILSRRKECIRA